MYSLDLWRSCRIYFLYPVSCNHLFALAGNILVFCSISRPQREYKNIIFKFYVKYSCFLTLIKYAQTHRDYFKTSRNDISATQISMWGWFLLEDWNGKLTRKYEPILVVINKYHTKKNLKSDYYLKESLILQHDVCLYYVFLRAIDVGFPSKRPSTNVSISSGWYLIYLSACFVLSRYCLNLPQKDL